MIEYRGESLSHIGEGFKFVSKLTKNKGEVSPLFSSTTSQRGARKQEPRRRCCRSGESPQQILLLSGLLSPPRGESTVPVGTCIVLSLLSSVWLCRLEGRGEKHMLALSSSSFLNFRVRFVPPPPFSPFLFLLLYPLPPPIHRFVMIKGGLSPLVWGCYSWEFEYIWGPPYTI